MGTKKAEPNVKVLSLSTLSYLPLTAHPPQSGFYPTIPLNQLQPRLPTAFSSQSQWSVFSSFSAFLAAFDNSVHPFLLENLSSLSTQDSSLLAVHQHSLLSYLFFSRFLFYSSLKYCSSSQFPFSFSYTPWSISPTVIGSNDVDHQTVMIYCSFISRLVISPELQILLTNYLVDNPMWKFYWASQTQIKLKALPSLWNLFLQHFLYW